MEKKYSEKNGSPCETCCHYEEKRMDILFEVMDNENDVTVTDGQGIVLRVSHSYEKHYGLKKEEIIRLIKWTDGQGIKLVVDESFADFSDEPDNSLIEQKFIETYRRLYVMKSISKSYGVPGLRLGILVSSDTEAIAAMKKDVAIWNINSFGEYYLQIAEKYKKDYAAAMDKFRVERKRFYNELEQISGIRVIPSQANYFMIEITNGMTAKELMIKLFKNHYLLIKDLTSKLHDGKQYIRIAIRNDVDNNKMIEALKKELN